MENPILLKHEGEILDTDKTVYCRILHLSDLHLSINSSGNEFELFCSGTKPQSTSIDEHVTDLNELLKNYGLRGYLQKKPVDCIVITGDFTNRGDFSENNIRHIKKQLTELYGICAQAGDWRYHGERWRTSLPMNRLFYCAGNHDLLRDAACYEPREGKYIFRQEVVRKLVKHQEVTWKEGYLPSQDAAEHSLLTKFSFGPFFEMLESLRRGNEKKQEVNSFEGAVFHLKAGEHSTGPDICFAAINTALLAGNADSVDLNTVQTSLLKMLTSVDTQEKSEAAKKYCDLLQKQAGGVINDDGKMCMPSEDTLESLAEEIRKSSSYIGIMLGHHNYSLLCANAQKAFLWFVKKCGIDLYLCGHTHRPDNNHIAMTPLYSRDHNLSICVSSGAFFDKTDYYSSLGFSLHTILRSNEDSFFCQSENIVYFRLPEIWMDINVDTAGTPTCFKLDVSKVEPTTADTPDTSQPEDGTENIEHEEDKNVLKTSDNDNRKEIPKDQMNIPEKELSARANLKTPLGEGEMGSTEHIGDENPLMRTDCKAITNDEAIYGPEKNQKNVIQKKVQQETEAEKESSADDEMLYRSLSSGFTYLKLPPDILTSSGN